MRPWGLRGFQRAPGSWRVGKVQESRLSKKNENSYSEVAFWNLQAKVNYHRPVSEWFLVCTGGAFSSQAALLDQERSKFKNWINMINQLTNQIAIFSKMSESNVIPMSI